MLQRIQPELPEGFQLLPAIDLRGGQVVRLAEGDFARETVYGTDPADVARSFVAAGARWIHVVDLDGARDGAARQTDAVARIVAAVGDRVACEVAGGLRDEAAVEAALGAGAARAVVGTAALSHPDLVERLIGRFGAARIAIALDVREGMAVGQGWVRGASGVPVEQALAGLSGRGARTFIVTAIERDGLLNGPNLELLARIVALGRGDIIASAGISSLADISSVRAIGCVGAIVGRAIYEGRVELSAAVRLMEAI
ncbi:MAG TPA: 1-(5-phosphoribosyl)-5-[(5-phosphoribosylamino)methylideneamino] imidazole-4-carboxamide isomerase [Terriglobales bacterium]|nr:1-(5-phosphoribosyl)-5-[(5-phosphoribosylamino)methylideneamino] imidazole-4-carboxamide isomerase [Terriglobales bacterium]